MPASNGVAHRLWGGRVQWDGKEKKNTWDWVSWNATLRIDILLETQVGKISIAQLLG